MSRYFITDAKDITINTNDIINDIPTRNLEIELEDRKELKEKDPEQFKKDERYRDGESTVIIDLEDYNLIDKDDVEPSFFSKDTLIEYLERMGYAVFDKTFTDMSNVDNLYRYLTDMPNWKRKEYLCDILGLNHFSTVDDIANEIKNLLK